MEHVGWRVVLAMLYSVCCMKATMNIYKQQQQPSIIIINIRIDDQFN